MAKRVALVLEGGGMRGMFTAGVLDVLLEQGICGFETLYGVSAGAINGADFLAKQAGRFCRDVLAFRDNPNFMGMWSLVHTGNVSGRDFMCHDVNTVIDPFDTQTFNQNPTKFIAIATDLTFGTAAYLQVDKLPQQFDAIIASSSLPCLSEIVNYEGYRLLDGGTADSVPVDQAFADGADHVVAVLTRARDYVKGPYTLQPMAERLYADYPYYLEQIKTRPERYNAQRKHIFELEAEGKITVIAPPRPVELTVMAQDGSQLLQLYVDGRRMAMGMLDQLRALLS